MFYFLLSQLYKMESLPGNRDEQANVLSRLPTMEFLGLKSVSKDWCRFISELMSENSFVKQYVKRNEPTSGFFYQERFKWYDDDIRIVNYITAGTEDVQAHRRVLEFLPEHVVLQASTNGLLCCRSCFGSEHRRIYICNPINKEYISLQFPQFDTRSSLALAFDPFSDGNATTFKVVRVYDTKMEKNDSLFVFDVYSSESKTWRMSVERCHCTKKLIKNKGIFVAGHMYWLTDGGQILMFSPQSELSLLIAMPSPQSDYRSLPHMCLGDYEGKLCYVVVSVDGLVLWVLEDVFNSVWKLERSLALQQLQVKHRSFPKNTSGRIRNANREVPFIDPLVVAEGQLLMRVSVDIFLYDFNTGEMKKPCELSMLGFNYMCSPVVLPYTASLVRLSDV